MQYIENRLEYETYHHLRESVGWKHFPREQAEQALAKSIFSVTAYDGRRPVAMGRLVGDGMYYIIVDMVVDPEFQGRNIGTAVLDKIVQHVRRQLPEGGRSSVYLIAAQGKEGFYEKNGFKKLPSRVCGSGMRKVVRNVRNGVHLC